MTVIIVYWLIGLIDWLVDIDTTNSYETTSQLQSDRLTTGKPSTLLLLRDPVRSLARVIIILHTWQQCTYRVTRAGCSKLRYCAIDTITRVVRLEPTLIRDLPWYKSIILGVILYNNNNLCCCAAVEPTLIRDFPEIDLSSSVWYHITSDYSYSNSQPLGSNPRPACHCSVVILERLHNNLLRIGCAVVWSNSSTYSSSNINNNNTATCV